MEFGDVTISDLISFITKITVISGFFIASFKWYKTRILDEFENLHKEIRHLKRETAKQEEKIMESKEERHILLEAVLVTMKTLNDKWDNNDDLKGVICKINDYLINK